MISRLSALLILLVALSACGAGRSIRVAEGEETTSSEPVSLAPAPEAEPEPASQPQPASEPDYEPQPASEPAVDTPPVQGYAPYEGTRDLDIRRIGQWTRTGIGEARRLVIRDANGWAQFWSELAVGDRPEVDFTREVVIAVAAGQRSTGGYEIAIDRVSQANGELRVEVIEKAPGPNCMTTASLTQPVDVVVVPSADARSWRFVERKEIRGCR